MEYFLKEIIYSYNKRLKKGDLDKLLKLFHAYDMNSYLNIILTYDFITIVNYIVLNELPYSVACKFMYNDSLLYNFIEYDKEFIYIGDNPHFLIDRQIEKLNRILHNDS